MKRIYAALILAVLTAAVFLTGHYYIKKTVNQSYDLLDRCVTAYESGERSPDYADKLEKYWAKRERFLSFFANHGELDDLEIAIHSVKIFSTGENAFFFAHYADSARTLLKQMHEDNILNMHSFF